MSRLVSSTNPAQLSTGIYLTRVPILKNQTLKIHFHPFSNISSGTKQTEYREGLDGVTNYVEKGRCGW